MRRLLLVLALVIAGLLVLNGCVAETQETSETPEQPGETEETVSASGVYEAIEPLLNAELEASYSVLVTGIVTYGYYYKGNHLYLQDPDGNAGVRVDLQAEQELPAVNSKIVVCGNLVKYHDTYNTDLITYKIQDATYEVLEENVTVEPVEIDETMFSTENLYKRFVLVNATGTVLRVDTRYHMIYMEIPVGDATKEIAVYSYKDDVKNWIDEMAETLVGSTLYVIGNWDNRYGYWRILPRGVEDIPMISE